MSKLDGGAWSSGPAPLYAPRPPLPYAALAGVRTRRLAAFCVDVVCIAILWVAIVALAIALGFPTMGMTWVALAIALPALLPVIAFFYNGLTMSGWRMGTPGMGIMDLEARLTDGSRVPFLNAAVHAVMLYVSWMFPLVFLVSLFADEKRCLHDILAGIVITRRA